MRGPRPARAPAVVRPLPAPDEGAGHAGGLDGDVRRARDGGAAHLGLTPRPRVPGWSPGQLEVEIATGSWFVVDTESGDAFTDEPDDLWRRVLRRQRDPLRWVAWFPSDPSLN